MVCYQRYVLTLLLEIDRISALKHVVKHDGGTRASTLHIHSLLRSPLTLNLVSKETWSGIREL